MKKLLGAVLALALVIPAMSASAEILKNLKVGGNLDFQGNSARNVTDFSTYRNDRIGTAVTRVLLDVNWDLLDDIHAVTTLRKNDREWGSNLDNANNADGSQTLSGATGSNDLTGNLYIQQAYVKIDKFAGSLDAQVGRQYFGEPGDLVIYYGPKNAYGLHVTALDAFRMDWSNDTVGLTGLAAKANTSGAIATPADAETDIRGIVAALKSVPDAKLNLYVYNRVQHNNSLDANGIRIYQPNDNLWIYGFKAKYDKEGAYAGLQMAGNIGENRGNNIGAAGPRLYRGWAGLVDVGYKADISNVGAFTPWATAGFGTGDQGNSHKNHAFTPIASGYAPGIINGRFNANGPVNLACGGNNAYAADTASLQNRAVYGLGLKYTPAQVEKLIAGLGFWDYQFQTMTQGSAQFLVNNAGTNKTSRHIGYEYGLTLDWKHSDNVSYGIGYARFTPGRFINDNNSTTAGGAGIPSQWRGSVRPIEFAFADLSVKF